jgi:hypothetical protein
MSRLGLRAALAALVLPLAVPLALAPASPAAAEDCVRLVIEGRELGGSSVQCVDPGSNGISLLRNGGHSLRFDSSGLLCAIDGRPATGCGEPAPGGGYSFWSYWTSGDSCSWSFSNRGPSSRSFSSRPAADGWVWVNGGGQTSRPPTSSACAAAAQSPPPPPPPPPSGGGGTGGTGAAGGSAAGSTGSSGGASSGSGSSGSGSSGASSGSSSSGDGDAGGSTADGSAGPDSDDGSGAGAAGADADLIGGAATADGLALSGAPKSLDPDGTLAEARGRAATEGADDAEDSALVGTASDGISPLTALGLLAALGLGGLAFALTRRRRTDESAIG